MKPVIIMGVHYVSIRELQKAYPYLSVTTLANRINRGLEDEEIIAPASKTPLSLTIDGNWYPSMVAAAKDANIKYPTYRYRTRRALNGDAGAVVRMHKTPRSPETYASLRKGVLIEGVYYTSYTEASEALNINYQTLVSRIKNGWYNHEGGEMMSPPKKKTREFSWGDVITYNGVTYRSKAALAMAYGADPTRFRRLLASGRSIEDALMPAETILYDGIEYKSKSAIARAYGVDVRHFLYSLECGHDIVDALNSAKNVKNRSTYKRTAPSKKAYAQATKSIAIDFACDSELEEVQLLDVGYEIEINEITF